MVVYFCVDFCDGFIILWLNELGFLLGMMVNLIWLSCKYLVVLCWCLFIMCLNFLWMVLNDIGSVLGFGVL